MLRRRGPFKSLSIWLTVIPVILLEIGQLHPIQRKVILPFVIGALNEIRRNHLPCFFTAG